MVLAVEEAVDRSRRGLGKEADSPVVMDGRNGNARAPSEHRHREPAWTGVVALSGPELGKPLRDSGGGYAPQLGQRHGSLSCPSNVRWLSHPNVDGPQRPACPLSAPVSACRRTGDAGARRHPIHLGALTEL